MEEGIQIRKHDDNGKPNIQQGNPKIVPPFEFLKYHLQIIQGLTKYVEYWKSWVDQKGENSQYAIWIQPIIEYWENIISLLRMPNVQEVSTCKDFWRKSSILVEDINETSVHEELLGLHDLDDHYCGPSSNKPMEEYMPKIDVKKNDFVLVRPSDNIYPIWLGVALSDVDGNNTSINYMKVKVHYWAPMCRKKDTSISKVYKDCWTKYWMCNIEDPERWEHVNSIVCSWTSKQSHNIQKNKDTKKCVLKSTRKSKMYAK